jgi:hypothetical protein
MARVAIPSPERKAPSEPVDALEVFRARAEARAHLYATGEFDLLTAVDVLQDAAIASGLLDQIGQHAVQAIIAAAFAPALDGEMESVFRALNNQTSRKANGRDGDAPLVNRPEDFRLNEETEEQRTPADGLEGVSLDDFHAYMPQHSYIYAPTREMWAAASVNARVAPIPLIDGSGKPVLDDNGKPKTVPATAWLDQNKPVEQLSWAPGLPMLVKDRLISEGGWIERANVTVFNQYRPPMIDLGDAGKADPWLAHVYKVYPENADHIIRWCAQRAQSPQTKINHALVLGGLQGIGKDTLLEPVKRAVGPWNCCEVSPKQMMSTRFNGYLKSVILRVSEARDLGDIDRYAFYDALKSYTAAPPDTLRVDEKNIREHHILNCVGIVITTNYKAAGIYLPADDRRHFVAWSELTKEDFAPDYWKKLWGWYDQGGDRHVAAYLRELNLSSFDPKVPPPKTAAFWDIVDSNRAPEDAELADALDGLGNPNATTLSELIKYSNSGEFVEWLKDRKNRRVIAHRFEQCGYCRVRNDAAKDGMWKVNGIRQVIYAKSSLAVRDRYIAASDLANR